MGDSLQVMFLQTAYRAASLCMVLASLAFAKPLTLINFELKPDSLESRTAHLFLYFDGQPATFPIYAMTEPERIVVDLVSTRMAEGISNIDRETILTSRIAGTELKIGGEINTRIEIFCKGSVHYNAYRMDKQMILTIKAAEITKKKVDVFAADSAGASEKSIRSIEVRALEKSVEIDVGFQTVPQTASIYMLESPPRIIMDFHSVLIANDFEKEVNVPPIKKISVIRKTGQVPYVGIIVALDRKTRFSYEQQATRILVHIPVAKKRRMGLVLVASGVVLTGGIISGILLGGEGENGTPPGQPGDLGAPPSFPNY